MTRIEVLAPGALTTIQDLGRPGWAHIGVPRSGAADRDALRLANRLVGNAEGAAALETTLAGPRLRFAGTALVAITGAPVSATVNGLNIPMGQAVSIEAGDELRVGTARLGLRSYVAFAGGLDVPLVLGSAATDTLTGLGPARLRHGDALRVALNVHGGEGGRGPAAGARAADGVDGEEREAAAHDSGDARLRVLLGPREDWFSGLAIERLTGEAYTVTPASNRVGVRFDGPMLERSRSDELRSEGLVPGAIQVPADGRPIMLLVDHPTTGGYPVIAVVHSADLGVAAQLRPGVRVRFFAL